MANYYALNTPFINYFFYKAPFVNNAYSLTDLEVLDGGTGYNVDDIIIFAGGTFTNPAVVQVSNVEAGVITAVIITQNGKYTVTPTTFTQLATNGTGTGATFNNLIFQPNLVPPGPNVPLSGGFIYFYEDDNRTVKANTYSDVFDPLNPVVNDNPIQLGAAGNYPPIYLEDRYYYIVITDNTGDESNPVQVLEHFNPRDAGIQPTAFNDNFIVNPQFNYPIEFWKTTDEEGEVTEPITDVAWGWQFRQDAKTTTKNFIRVERVTGAGIEGSPINQIVLDSSTVSGDETQKDFVTFLGAVDFYAGKNLTFSTQLVSLRPQSANVDILLEYYYGVDGDDTVVQPITTFTVGTTREKHSYSFTVNSIAGKDIGEGNYLALLIRPALGSVCEIGMTNDMALPGVQLDAVFNDEPYGFSKGEIIGAQTEIDGAGLNENYSFYYYKDGKILPWADTGTIVLETKDAVAPLASHQPFRRECNGDELLVNDYSETGIPYRRLYEIIGTTYGGSGTLECTASNNTVLAQSVIGGVPKTAWADVDAGVTITETAPGLEYGLEATLISDTVVELVYTDMFAANQTPFTYTWSTGATYTPASGVMSYWTFNSPQLSGPVPITIATTVPGSGATKPAVTLTFNERITGGNMATRPRADNIFGQVSSSFIDFPLFADNTRGSESGAHVYTPVGLIYFEVDGIADLRFVDEATTTIKVPFSTLNTLGRNLRSFVKAVNTNFAYTILFNRLPLESEHFLYSDIDEDFYLWYEVDGVGTDPAVMGRTGVKCVILSSYTLPMVAVATTIAMNKAAFLLPDLDATGIDPNLAYYINL